MINLNDFVEQPGSIATFINNLKAGSFSINWKEILADEDKLVNLHEVTFSMLVQLADTTQTSQIEKIAPILGKFFILMRHIEIAENNNNSKEMAQLTQQFEASIKELAQMFTPEQINQIVQSAPKDPQAFNPNEMNPLLTLIITLKLLVHADQILDEEEGEEEGDDECCDDEDDNSGCC